VILVDSSVWIDYFNGVETAETDQLHGLLDEELVLIGDLVLVEVLQGLRRDADFRMARDLLDGLAFAELGGRDVALAAAGNYRTLRRHGLTVRKTIDVVIASFCLLHGHRLLYSDRDFDALAEHLGLLAA